MPEKFVTLGFNKGVKNYLKLNAALGSLCITTSLSEACEFDTVEQAALGAFVMELRTKLVCCRASSVTEALNVKQHG